MQRFQIENTISGVILGEYFAETESEALDLLAQDAGYANHAQACDVAPMQDGELMVSHVPDCNG